VKTLRSQKLRMRLMWWTVPAPDNELR
jgi:hypothetical protein